MLADMAEVSRILSAINSGDTQAAAELLTGYSWLRTLVAELDNAEKTLAEAEALEAQELQAQAAAQ